MTVHGLLRWRAQTQPDAVFLIFEDETGRRHDLTYSDAWQRAQATAQLLHGQGVGAGDRVLVALPNCLEFFDLWFATGVLGATLVPVNPLSTPDELAWVLTDASCRLCVGDATTAANMSALVTGASVAMAAKFSASGWGRQAAELGATLASLFAAPIRMILASAERPHDRGNRLRATLFAQNLTVAQAADFCRRFGTPLLQLYGMTETIAPPTCNPLYGEQRPESIGPPIAGVRLRVVGEDGHDVPAGAPGELLVGGQPGRTLMAGYLNRPDATEQALRDGWLHTGDLVRVDANGYLYFVDRAKDMIKRAGENVAASEVERVLNEHPGVFESAAVGVPDAIRDEAIVVHVVRKPAASVTEQELAAWCTERLARFKVPSAIRFTGELPRTSVGKIRKEVLRQQETGENAPGGNP